MTKIWLGSNHVEPAATSLTLIFPTGRQMGVTEPGYHTGWSKGDGRTNGRVSRLSLESGIKRITSAMSKGATAGRHKRTTDTRKEGWGFRAWAWKGKHHSPSVLFRGSERTQPPYAGHGATPLEEFSLMVFSETATIVSDWIHLCRF